MKTDTTVVTNKALLARKSHLVSSADIQSGYARKTVELLKEKVRTIERSRGQFRRIGGLSAIQMDKTEAVCIVRNWHTGWIVLVNPLIIDKSAGVVKNYEQCLSFPHKPFEVQRYEWITVRYLKLDGSVVEKTFSGKVGRRVQHELDHINGIIPSKTQFERGLNYMNNSK